MQFFQILTSGKLILESMNPEPLKSYKAKAYNPGSPAPNPTKEQFSNFPKIKDLESEFEFSSGLKIDTPSTVKSSSKRKIGDVESDKKLEFYS